MLKELTDAQKAGIEVMKAKWDKLGLSTETIDREKCVASLKKLYESNNLPFPRVIFAQSPIEAKNIANQLKKEAGETNLDNTHYEFISGGMETWLAFYDFFKNYVPEVDVSEAIPLIEACQNTGWVMTYDTVCIVCDRPSVFKIDEQDRLHSETGPALEFRDGYKLWFVHGVEVNEKIIMSPQDLTVKEIRETQNAEVRRISRERFGEDRYLRECDAKVIDIDTVSTIRDGVSDNKPSDIIRALIEDDLGDRYLVGSDGSTKRTYYMKANIIGGQKPNTCKEAYELLTGLSEDKCIAQS